MYKPPRTMSLFIAAVLAAVTFLSGCAADLKAPVGKSQGASIDQQRRAVSLYVDAAMLNDLEEYEKAAQKLDAALQIDPLFVLAWSLKGEVCEALGLYSESADAYEQATNLDPWSFKDFMNLGRTAQKLGQVARAARAYGAACQLESGDYDCHVSMARCYRDLGDQDSALTFAEKARQINADKAEPELIIGDILEARGDHTGAQAAYGRAAELEGHQPRITVPMAASHLRAGNFEVAKEMLLAALEREPTNAMAHQYLGYAWLKLKDVDQAIASYELASQIEPGDWMARKGLGVAYILKATQGQDEALRTKGLSQWRRSLEINPQQPELHALYERYAGHQAVSP